MLVSHKHKFVFISIPKTGSTSLRNTLSEYGDVFSNSDADSAEYVHIKAQELKKHFIKNKWNWDEYFKFAFVRNPWDSIVSQYFYKINFINKEKLNIPYNKKFMFHCKSLKKNCNNFNSAVKFNLLTFTNQIDWIVDDQGKCLINFIGRFENLEQDFKTICKRIGLPEKRLHLANTTAHEYYGELYDKESMEIVKEKFKKDIEIFDYEFIGTALNEIKNSIYDLCNICGDSTGFKDYKPSKRNNNIISRNRMYCERCDSQERHRFMLEYIKRNESIIKNKQIVHCASELCLLKHIRKLAKTYYKIDINPNPNQVKMDILDMSFQSESIDTFLCSHVLEHIENDDKAIKEIVRILKKEGKAILLVPINGRKYTTEFLIPNEEDFNHYRNYGYIDFINKLKLYFSSVKRILPQDILTEQHIDLCSLSYEKDQGIFECKK